MLRIAIIIGSTRPRRRGEAVGKWVYEQAVRRGDAEYELIDLKAVGLPLLDEPQPASSGEYSHEHTRAWSARIAPCDAFVFVTPEYNQGTCAALKNALDFLYKEWNDKAAGFVGYGGVGGARAVTQLRITAAALQMAAVRPQVALMTATDWENDVFQPAARHEKALKTVLDHVNAWGRAMKTLRNGTE